MQTSNSCDLIFTSEAVSQLTPAQTIALQKLTGGLPLSVAADAAGVNRSTVYRWLEKDPAFKAAYRDWRTELARLAHARLMALSEAAVDAVAQAVEGGDARMAMTVLQRMGMMTAQEPE
jgi:hypothetical protein